MYRIYHVPDDSLATGERFDHVDDAVSWCIEQYRPRVSYIQGVWDEEAGVYRVVYFRDNVYVLDERYRQFQAAMPEPAPVPVGVQDGSG